jgi:hypothetical protein
LQLLFIPDLFEPNPMKKPATGLVAGFSRPAGREKGGNPPGRGKKRNETLLLQLYLSSFHAIYERREDFFSEI